MDTSTLIACILGGLILFCAVVFGGQAGFAPFWSVPALFIVLGGTAIALFVAFPLNAIVKSLSAIRKCFTTSMSDAKNIIAQVVSFAESARREGLLAQERRLDEVRDPFLAEGLHLIVDGLPPATVESILNSEIEAMQHRHQQSGNIMLYCGRCAPAFGMIGTLIGLVLMLTELDAETVGPGMAVAILTTLYGLLAANLVFMPMAEKLKQLHGAEMRIKTMIVRGVLAIQSGEHPRIIQMKLLTFLSPEERPNEDKIARDDVQTIPLPMEEDDMMEEIVEVIKQAA
jgi:chemotaxis protein MotA